MLNFNSLRERFHDQYENDEFEVKSSFISIEKISKIILSFMNNEKKIECGYIIVGVNEKTYSLEWMSTLNAEDNLEDKKLYVVIENNELKYRVKNSNIIEEGSICSADIKGKKIPNTNDLNLLYPLLEKILEVISKRGHITIGQADFDSTESVDFPQTVVVQDNGKKNFNSYTDLLSKIVHFLKENTTPTFEPGNFIEAHPIVNPSNRHNIVLIKITRNPQYVIQYSDKKFYGRLKEVNQNDFGSHPMSAIEVFKRKHERDYDINNLPRPIYYDSRPAVPELTILFDAIYLNKFEEVEEILKQFKTLTQMTDSKGNNALHIASLYGRKNIVNILINTYKMSTRQTNHEGENPLLVAAYGGKLEIVEMLINIDRNSIYQRDRLGYDVFLKACGYGHCELINFLHKKYGDMLFKTKTYSGWNGLQVAAYSPSIMTVGHLLKLHKWGTDDLEKALNTAKSYRENAEKSDIEFIQKRIIQYKAIESIIISYRCHNDVENAHAFFYNRNVTPHASGLPRNYTI